MSGDDPGYTLEIAPDAVDAARCRVWRPEVYGTHRGRCGDRDDHAVEGALALYHGESCATRARRLAHSAIVRSLEDTRSRILEDLYAARIRLGAIGGMTGI